MELLPSLEVVTRALEKRLKRWCLPSIEWNRLCPAFTRACKYAYVMLTESAEVNMLRT